MLEVIRGAGMPSALAEKTFTGDVWRDVLLPDANGFSVGNNFFAPCARTYWHSHPGGQLLVILAGSGIVADRDGPVSASSGDVVWTPPGVAHWHGGSGQRYVLHTAVTLNGVEWHDAVTDDEFASAMQYLDLAGADPRISD